MKTIAQAFEDYIELRRDLGFKMTGEQPMLRSFTDFMAR